LEGGPLSELLDGEVEIDSTYIGYIGGKEGNRHMDKRGRSALSSKYSKVPVFALVERGGELRAKKMKTVSNDNVKEAGLSDVSRDATLMTDQVQQPQDFGWGTSYKGYTASGGKEADVQRGHEEG
jgi:hypothetical protein